MKKIYLSFVVLCSCFLNISIANAVLTPARNISVETNAFVNCLTSADSNVQTALNDLDICLGNLGTVSFIDSLIKSGNNVSLVNDSSSPGNSYYYGTNASGTRGYFALSTSTGTVTSILTSNGITGGPITTSGTISGINAASDGSTKGVAAFNATDFSCTLGICDTSQGIAITSSPTFANINLTGYLSISSNKFLWTVGTSASSDIFMGVGTGNTSATANNNIGIGSGALANLASGGFQDVAVGNGALAANTSGGSNTSMGYAAGGGITSGGSNTLIGDGAGDGITTASNNVIAGYNAGQSGNCSDDILLGYMSACRSSSTNWINGIAIGYNATLTANNQMVIGDNSGTAYISSIYLGSGVTATSSSLHNISINATGGSGSNIGGANLTMAGGISTGTANGGSVILSTSSPGSSGSSANSLTTRLTVDTNGLFTVWDGGNMALGTSIGTKIGTTTSQKLGFYGATPLIQPTGNICTALQSIGLIASCSESVSSVTNSDGTLTISPTTGSVVASLALGNANTWTGQQTFNNSAPIIGTATASTIAGFDSSKDLITLATATYPSLTELSYEKGVTSAIQTQINGKSYTAIGSPITGSSASKILWMNSSNDLAQLTLGTNLSITGSTLNASGGGGGSQTPWTSNINGAGYALNGASFLNGMGTSYTVAPISPPIITFVADTSGHPFIPSADGSTYSFIVYAYSKTLATYDIVGSGDGSGTDPNDGNPYNIEIDWVASTDPLVDGYIVFFDSVPSPQWVDAGNVITSTWTGATITISGNWPTISVPSTTNVSGDMQQYFGVDNLITNAVYGSDGTKYISYSNDLSSNYGQPTMAFGVAGEQLIITPNNDVAGGGWSLGNMSEDNIFGLLINESATITGSLSVSSFQPKSLTGGVQGQDFLIQSVGGEAFTTPATVTLYGGQVGLATPGNDVRIIAGGGMPTGSFGPTTDGSSYIRGGYEATSSGAGNTVIGEDESQTQSGQNYLYTLTNIQDGLANNTAGTSENCATSGTVTWDEVELGTGYKKVVGYASACLGASASFSYPNAFAHTPACLTTNELACSLLTTLSTSAVVLTGTTTTGYIFIEGN